MELLIQPNTLPVIDIDTNATSTEVVMVPSNVALHSPYCVKHYVSGTGVHREQFHGNYIEVFGKYVYFRYILCLYVQQ